MSWLLSAQARIPQNGRLPENQRGKQQRSRETYDQKHNFDEAGDSWTFGKSHFLIIVERVQKNKVFVNQSLLICMTAAAGILRKLPIFFGTKRFGTAYHLYLPPTSGLPYPVQGPPYFWGEDSILNLRGLKCLLISWLSEIRSAFF